MPITFEQSKDKIAHLVQHFRTNQAQYHTTGYKEAHARQEFIDPLFAVLGWDVSNAQHAAPDYREVDVEPSLDVEGHQKAPDYGFRVGRDLKFYVEAKRPGVDIKADAGPAYQLRRYAWTARLPLSILTDFEELAAYDCRKKPSEKDKPAVARVQLLTYEEYPDRWNEVWDVFSREAVLGGAFDQYAEGAGRRGISPVDVEFLKEIEGWRDLLARNLALRNPRLTVDELNDAVQKTIDRVVFLRMAEDRGMEDYGRLLRLAEGPGAYPGLIRLARQADDKYNSGLFDFARDKLTPRLSLDDKALAAILKSLYFPQSPYAFKVLPPEILGSVYERFLGKVIRLTAGHQAKVEEKPEVRKAGGVYYTPGYIVDYIVEQTVARQIAGKSPAQLRGYRVLDMACGSGSFLVGAYRALLDHYLRWYSENEPGRHAKAVYEVSDVGYDPHPIPPPNRGRAGWGFRLTTSEKKRILTEHIFGVDIDRQAVEVTKLSLLLQVLEGETDETLGKQLRLLHDRALPDLDRNIQCGNSLIGPDYFSGRLLPDAEELARVNPFDWKAAFPEAMAAGGFDAVIGNPPYVRMEGFKELKAYFKAKYACHDERSDLYAYFIERAHVLLRMGGRFGMIISNKFLRAKYGAPLRGYLRSQASIEIIVDLAGLPVFEGATVRTVVIVSHRGNNGSKSMVYVPPLPFDIFASVARGFTQLVKAIAPYAYEVSPSALEGVVWQFVRGDTHALLAQLRDNFVPLGELPDATIGYGIKSGLEEAFVINAIARDGILRQNKRAEEIIKPYLNGRDIRRYLVDFKDAHLIYTDHGVDISRYPGVVRHLKQYRGRLEERATKQRWYELQQPQHNYSRYFAGRKIVFPDIATGPRFALDEEGLFGSTTTFFVGSGDPYLLGLLNSRLSSFYFRETCAALEGKADRYLRFKRQYVEGFPVRPIDFSNSGDKARHDQMVALVERMLELHKRKQAAGSDHERQLLQRQIDSTDGEIDALVYELYGLTEEEIKIVEGTPSQPSP